MVYLHPLFMIALFVGIGMQARLGLEILALHAKSPDMTMRPQMVQRHRTMAVGLLILVFFGALGGIGTTMKYLFNESGQPVQLFDESYGHGYLGLAIFGSLLTMAALGVNIKRITKDKIRVRFLDFHRNLIWVVGGLGLFSLCTGLAVLWTMKH